MYGWKFGAVAARARASCAYAAALAAGSVALCLCAPDVLLPAFMMALSATLLLIMSVWEATFAPSMARDMSALSAVMIVRRRVVASPDSAAGRPCRASLHPSSATCRAGSRVGML